MNMSFEETLKIHLDSMKNRDFDTFIQTVCVEEVTLIMPNGTLISDKDEFVNLHKEWFADEDWGMEYTLIRTEIGDNHGFALMAVDYSDCDGEGNPVRMKYYLSLIFRRQGEEWKLIQDQNTIFK